VQSEIVELRYSLNGITQAQLDLLFSSISDQDDQIMIKRISDPHAALSMDDLVLEGIFSDTLIQNLSRAYPPPLAFKLQLHQNISAQMRQYSAFEWQEAPTLYCGVSLLPFMEMQQMIAFDDAWHFLRLVTTTQAATLLKSLLAVKPKGVISWHKNLLHFVFPLHRMDFLQQWANQLGQGTANLNWLSGSTGELAPEILQSVGSVDQEAQPKIAVELNRTKNLQNLDFERLFNRVLSVISI
jgi:hypothetical protein